MMRVYNHEYILPEDWSDWPYWWHYMAVNVPDGQRSEDDAAFFYVSYRNNNHP